MSNQTNNNMTLADLERLLDVYGSDRSRWPVEARAGAGHLAARDKEARRLLDEAEALDRILERAPMPSLAREAALADRIVAAAQRSPRIVRLEDAQPNVPASVSPLPAAGSAENVIRWPGARAKAQRLSFSNTSSVAGLMAACLMFGVYIGLANMSQGTIEDVAGLALGTGNTQLAQLDPLDDDLL